MCGDAVGLSLEANGDAVGLSLEANGDAVGLSLEASRDAVGLSLEANGDAEPEANGNLEGGSHTQEDSHTQEEPAEPLPHAQAPQETPNLLDQPRQACSIHASSFARHHAASLC